MSIHAKLVTAGVECLGQHAYGHIHACVQVYVSVRPFVKTTSLQVSTFLGERGLKAAWLHSEVYMYVFHVRVLLGCILRYICMLFMYVYCLAAF
jgi:hypothetical protein